MVSTKPLDRKAKLPKQGKNKAKLQKPSIHTVANQDRKRKLEGASEKTARVKKELHKASKRKTRDSGAIIVNEPKSNPTKIKKKTKNKYKTIAGNVKDVGQDTKIVNPVVDIPKKLKHAGIKVRNISEEHLKAAISEASNEKMKVKQLKRKNMDNHSEDVTKNNVESTESPPKKKKTRIQQSKKSSSENSESPAKSQALNDNLSSSVSPPKRKKKTKNLLQVTQIGENTLEQKFKQNSGSTSVSNKKKCISSNLIGNNNPLITKSGFSVHKLKSLLTQDEENVDETEVVVKGEEHSSDGNVKKKDKKKQEIKKPLKEALENRLMSSQFR